MAGAESRGEYRHSALCPGSLFRNLILFRCASVVAPGSTAKGVGSRSRRSSGSD